MTNRPEAVPGRFRALCCGCGELRSFKVGYTGGNQIGDTGLAQERCTIDLKCGACGRMTRHAYLLDFWAVPDFAERRNLPVPHRRDYDPLREVEERWREWSFTETTLPDGIIEIIDPERRQAYYDSAGWEGDPVLGLAHVLAHLDLGHHELHQLDSPGDIVELEAERLARERLDRSWPSG